MSAGGKTSTNSGTLADARIVVTRPAERGEALCRAITAAGGEALLFPTLDILPLEDATLPNEFQLPDWLVFTSVPSVRHGLGLLDDRLPDWRETRIAAIGDATAEALRAAGTSVITVPAAGQQQSEGLLECADFSAGANQSVLIVRGEGGRRTLDDELQRRGAKLHSVAVYRREPADIDPAPLLARWQAGRVDAIVISSADGLRALHAILDQEGREYLGRTQLVLPTARVIKLAQELGIQPEPVVATGASDEAVLQVLAGWWSTAGQPQ